MGLASALSTALTGLNAAETTIDVVGNNVANANTVGFKSSKALFATQFLQTRGLGSAPSENRGGNNPRQTGLGTKVAEITPDFSQGTIQISSNPSDLAIQGDGFFIVEGAQGEALYTRNGIFKTNANNELVTINGQRLLGHGIDDSFQVQNTTLQPLSIPLGTAAVAQATQNVVLEGTLTPTGDLADTPEIVQSAVLSDGSKEVPPDLAAGDVAALTAPVTSGSAAAPDAAAGSIAAGTYRYKVVFVQADGQEGPPSASIGPITTTGTPGVDQAVQLNGLPALGAGFTSMRIYRTDSTGAGDFKLVATTPGGPTFTDTLADASLGATLDDSTLAQGNYSYYVTFVNSATGLESRPTSLIGPNSITVDGRRIKLDNLPSPTSADFDQVRIYRNLSTNDTSFYRVATLAAGTTNYIDGASDASITNPANLINLDGPAISSGLRLVDVVARDGSTYGRPFEIGTLEFTGKKGGRTLSTKTLEITAMTTVGDLINFYEQALGIQDATADPTNPIPGSPGGSVTGSSRLQLESNRGTGNAVEIGISSMKITTATGQKSVNLGFNATQTAVGESAVTDFVVYDSLGIPLNVRVTAVLESRNGTSTTYRWFADSGDNDSATGVGIAVGTGQIVFDGEGNVTSISEDTVSIARETVSSASPLEFDLDLSRLSGLASSKSSLAATRQDGSAAGTLTSFIIGEDGLIRGIFSNGVTRDLGQIRLVRFANNIGLEQRGENLFASGVNSGLPIEGNPGEQGIGSIVAGATELSNTDIGQNLIDLITASTQYRGGTRVITSVQQLLDELLNLRR